ncbi:hypothetical protein D3C85_1439140 [compost metagenome]
MYPVADPTFILIGCVAICFDDQQHIIGSGKLFPIGSQQRFWIFAVLKSEYGYKSKFLFRLFRRERFLVLNGRDTYRIRLIDRLDPLSRNSGRLPDGVNNDRLELLSFLLYPNRARGVMIN